MLGILILLFILSLGYFFYTRPFESLDWIARKKMLLNGYSKKSLTTSEGEMTYFEGGTGKTVILIHGFMVHAGNWAQIAGDLAKTHHVLIPDLIGHGTSDLPANFSFAKILNGLEEFINERTGVSPIVLVGSSMGGWLSIHYANRNPRKVTKIFLENSAGLAIEADKKLLLPETREEAKIKVRELMSSKLDLPNFMLDGLIRLNKPKHYELYDEMAGADYFVEPFAPNLTMPVHLLWGEADGLFPMSYAQQLAALFPNSTLHTFPDVAHLPHSTNTKTFMKTFQPLL